MLSDYLLSFLITFRPKLNNVKHSRFFKLKCYEQEELNIVWARN